MTNEWRWLASTRELQERYFNRDFDNQEPDEFADAIVMNHSALICELTEFMDEIGWKDWAAPRGWVNRDAAVGELVDVAHFLANLLLRLNVDDDEWEQRYRAKQEVNRQRKRSSYDGVSNKCPKCKRALDDVGSDPITGLCHLCVRDALAGPAVLRRATSE